MKVEKNHRIHVSCEQCGKSGIMTMTPKMIKWDAQLRVSNIRVYAMCSARSLIFNSGNFSFLSLSFGLYLPLVISLFSSASPITIASNTFTTKKCDRNENMINLSIRSYNACTNNAMNCQKHNQLRNEDKTAMESV